MPCIDKVGRDTLEGPRFMAKQDSYNVQCTEFAAKQLHTRGFAQAITKGLLLAQTVPS